MNNMNILREGTFSLLEELGLSTRNFPQRSFCLAVLRIFAHSIAHLGNYSPVSVHHNSGLGEETDLSAAGELTPLGTLSLSPPPPPPPPGLMSPLFLIPDAQLQNGMANTSQASVTTPPPPPHCMAADPRVT